MAARIADGHESQRIAAGARHVDGVRARRLLVRSSFRLHGVREGLRALRQGHAEAVMEPGFRRDRGSLALGLGGRRGDRHPRRNGGLAGQGEEVLSHPAEHGAGADQHRLRGRGDQAQGHLEQTTADRNHQDVPALDELVCPVGRPPGRSRAVRRGGIHRQPGVAGARVWVGDGLAVERRHAGEARNAPAFLEPPLAGGAVPEHGHLVRVRHVERRTQDQAFRDCFQALVDRRLVSERLAAVDAEIPLRRDPRRLYAGNWAGCVLLARAHRRRCRCRPYGQSYRESSDCVLPFGEPGTVLPSRFSYSPSSRTMR